MFRVRFWSRVALAGSCVTSMSPLPAMAQAPSYQPRPDTLYRETTNPFRMYFVRGSDTLGPRRIERSIERQVWKADSAGLSVAMTVLRLNITRARSSETFTLSRAGRVALIDGKRPSINSRTDLVPHLPNQPLRQGLQWTDTLTKEGQGPMGEQHYRVLRSYRVARIGDSLGMRMAWITSSGRVHFRHSWWTDSTAGSYVWIDAEGPMTERFTFDVRGGRLIDLGWEMRLIGLGGEPRAEGGTDTVAAGLNSAYLDRLITSERANLIGRDLVGRDTSWTFNPGAVLIHTVERRVDTVLSSMARNDGMVGSVSSVYRNGRPAGFRSTWTDSTGEVMRVGIAVAGRNLNIQFNDTSITETAPIGTWGIADYAMQEHLVPVLVTLPTGIEAPFSIYRPVGQLWDQMTALVRPLKGGFLISLQSKGKETQYLVVDSQGDLLYGENSDPVKAVRAPAEGGTRGQRLKEILEQLRQNAPSPQS